MAVWLLAELPVVGKLAVGEVVHHVGGVGLRHFLGTHPARIELAAHLTDQMRPALERKNPARDERGQEVGPRQALRLDHHPQSGDGGVSCLRQRHGPEGPLGQPARRWAGYVSRQVDVVAPGSDVPHVEEIVKFQVHPTDRKKTASIGAQLNPTVDTALREFLREN